MLGHRQKTIEASLSTGRTIVDRWQASQASRLGDQQVVPGETSDHLVFGLFRRGARLARKAECRNSGCAPIILLLIPPTCHYHEDSSSLSSGSCLFWMQISATIANVARRENGASYHMTIVKVLEWRGFPSVCCVCRSYRKQHTQLYNIVALL